MLIFNYARILQARLPTYIVKYVIIMLLYFITKAKG